MKSIRKTAYLNAKNFKNKCRIKYESIRRHLKYNLNPITEKELSNYYKIYKDDDVNLNSILEEITVWINKSQFVGTFNNLKVKNEVSFPYDIGNYNVYTGLEFYRYRGSNALDYLIGSIYYLGKYDGIKEVSVEDFSVNGHLIEIINNQTTDFKKMIRLGDVIFFRHPLDITKLYKGNVIEINLKYVTVSDNNKELIKINWDNIYKAYIKT